MPTPFDLKFPYGATPRGFATKNTFADQLRLLGDARVVMDVGTHAGDEAATYRTMFPEAEIHCFEPTPERATALAAAFAGDPRVVVHACALHERDGEAALHENPFDASNSLLPFDSRAAESIEAQYVATARTTSVPTRTLRSICAERGITTVDLLKLDVQGVEREVLRGAGALFEERRIRLIYTELIFVPLYRSQGVADELMALLRGAGYRLYDMYNFAYAESGQLLWGDAVFLPEA